MDQERPAPSNSRGQQAEQSRPLRSALTTSHNRNRGTDHRRVGFRAQDDVVDIPQVGKGRPLPRRRPDNSTILEELTSGVPDQDQSIPETDSTYHFQHMALLRQDRRIACTYPTHTPSGGSLIQAPAGAQHWKKVRDALKMVHQDWLVSTDCTTSQLLHRAMFVPDGLEDWAITNHFIHGDGNCLFRALSFLLYQHQTSHHSLRQRAVKFIIEHREDFAPFLDTTDGDDDDQDLRFEKWVIELAKPTTWADQHVINAISKLYQVSIAVVSGMGRQQEPSVTWHHPNGEYEEQNRVFTLYFNDSHYELLHPVLPRGSA